MISTKGLFTCVNAKNAMSRHEGYTPELWVLGKMKPVPGSLASGQLDSASFLRPGSKANGGKQVSADVSPP